MGASSRLGRTRAAITPETAKAAARVAPMMSAVSAMIARKPSQSPSDEVAAASTMRRNGRDARRALSASGGVAGRATGAGVRVPTDRPMLEPYR